MTEYGPTKREVLREMIGKPTKEKYDNLTSEIEKKAETFQKFREAGGLEEVVEGFKQGATFGLAIPNNLPTQTRRQITGDSPPFQYLDTTLGKSWEEIERMSEEERERYEHRKEGNMRGTALGFASSITGQLFAYNMVVETSAPDELILLPLALNAASGSYEAIRLGYKALSNKWNEAKERVAQNYGGEVE